MGGIVAKLQNEREYVCSCGTNMHRDHNAAIKMLQRGLDAREAARRLWKPNLDHQEVRAHGKIALEAA